MRRLALVILVASSCGCTQLFIYGRHETGAKTPTENRVGVEARWFLWDALRSWTMFGDKDK